MRVPTSASEAASWASGVQGRQTGSSLTYNVLEASLGVNGEHDATGTFIGAHHLLNCNGQANAKVVEALDGAV